MTSPRTGHPGTLPDLLARRAADDPDRIAYTFGDEPRSFGELWSDVEAFAAALLRRRIGHRDRVVLALANGHGFFTAFYGTQRAGAIPVPVFPYLDPERVLEMARMCDAPAIVVDPSRSQDLSAITAVGHAPAVIGPSERSAPTTAFPSLDPEATALIQYTSGSTGDPKGVELTHAGILTNACQMIEGMEITQEDRFVSWLPSYHDMGLILMTVVPFVLPAPLFLLPTSLRDIRAWLETITVRRATFTASPDFGYRLALRHVDRLGSAGHPYDLSSLRVALNAAETVRVDTVERFHRAFELRDVMTAGYGLAEATVGVSMSPPSTPITVDDRGAVSVGRPFPGVRVSVVDEDDLPVPGGVAGHLLVESPAVTRGYFGNPSATAALFAAPGTVRTGDIGHLDESGRLYILGRSKDVVIQAGRTIYPDEVEEAVNRVPGVRRSVGVGVDHGRFEGEQLTVFAEVRPASVRDDAARRACVMGIVDGIHRQLGLRPGRVHLVPPRTIPTTHNGKLRRTELRNRYLDGELDTRFLDPARSSQ